jgi:PAS domain S-box-containing protein
MSYKLTKRQSEILSVLASGLTEREACLRLKISEAQITSRWQEIGHKIETNVAETIEDYVLRSAYERVERQRLEAELWASEARLTSLMDTALEAVFVVHGRSGRILKANNQALILLGYTPKEVINHTVEMLVPQEARSKHVALRHGFLNNIRKREMGYHPPIFAVAKDGTRLELDIALTATASTDDVMVVCKLARSQPAIDSTEASVPAAELKAKASGAAIAAPDAS